MREKGNDKTHQHTNEKLDHDPNSPSSFHQLSRLGPVMSIRAHLGHLSVGDTAVKNSTSRPVSLAHSPRCVISE